MINSGPNFSLAGFGNQRVHMLSGPTPFTVTDKMIRFLHEQRGELVSMASFDQGDLVSDPSYRYTLTIVWTAK